MPSWCLLFGASFGVGSLLLPISNGSENREIIKCIGLSFYHLTSIPELAGCKNVISLD